jgi:NADH-quinone oxidoreductase subunit J
LIAIALFVTMAVTVLTVGDTGLLERGFPDPVGFESASVITGIGYALIGEPAAAGADAVFQNTESFLVALILLAILLDAALDGALMLASRDEGGDGQ